MRSFRTSTKDINTLIGQTLAKIQSDSAKLAGWSEDLITTSIRDSSFVNCWTKGPAENAAFWEIYGKQGTVVAIRSTYNKLRNVLPEEYVIGQIKYVDYDSSPGFSVAGVESAYPFLKFVYHKRVEYRYESEIRAARIPRVGEAFEQSSADIVIPNLSDLIENIYVRKSDPDEVKRRVKTLCSMHNLKYQESRIDGRPLQIRLTDEQRGKFMEKFLVAQIPLDFPEEFYAIEITQLLIETLRGE